METQPDIYVDKDLLNPKVMTVRDISYYDPDSEVTGGLLEISYPGSDVIIEIDEPTGFFQIINSNVLGITSSCGSRNLADLPDGLWVLKYSIDEDHYVEYKFLRNTLQLITYNNAYCSLDIRKCEERHYKQRLDQLRDIYNLIRAAEYFAECCRYTDSIKVYNTVEQLLADFTSDCGC